MNDRWLVNETLVFLETTGNKTKKIQKLYTLPPRVLNVSIITQSPHVTTRGRHIHHLNLFFKTLHFL